MSSAHAILVLIAIDLVAGQRRLKEIVHSLSEIGSVTGTSSVYKRFLTSRSEDLNSELVMVLKLQTEQFPEDIFRTLHEKQQDLLRSGHFVLLVYDNLVRLMPGQNLPSSLLHTDNLTLRCAAEAWGAYEHPVLGQTLNELVRSHEPLSNVEFFAQGRSLFSSESL
jgi:hypothetical protein